MEFAWSVVLVDREPMRALCSCACSFIFAIWEWEHGGFVGVHYYVKRYIMVALQMKGLVVLYRTREAIALFCSDFSPN